MVHDQRVFGDITGVAGLDEFHFHLAKMHKGVAPAVRHGTTALHRATTGVRGPEPLLEPLDGLVQVSYQVANVLNLIKHHLSFAYRVYDANVRCASRSQSQTATSRQAHIDPSRSTQTFPAPSPATSHRQREGL